ncbi:MAG TPA: DUF6798 domain-containing protein [Chitinophagales bacterium]|nr:DUF6798 domain-containing protein [Chitinophagales bacterium]
MRTAKPSTLFAFCMWSLLILRFGYRYGTGDQVELLPYTLYLHNPSLYPHDFFIKGLDASVPNERTIMATLLVPFVNHLEITCFLLQLLSTIFLVMGLEMLALRFIKNRYLAWLAIALAMLPLNNYTLGDVELYSECFQASGLAVAIVVWGINLFLDGKYIWASILMTVATFIHVLEGLDVMLVLSAIMLFSYLIKKTDLKTFLLFISIYGFTAGLFLLDVLIHKSGTVLTACNPASPNELFKIIFMFRLPHHFIFSTFPRFHMLVYFLFTLFALVYFAGHSSKTFEFILIGTIGMIIYAFAVDDFHSIFIGNFQFYKLSIWIKFLGVVAFVGLGEDFYLQHLKLPETLKIELPVLISGIAIAWLIIINFNSFLPYKVPFQLFGMKEKDDMINICEQIKEKTPADAVFIQSFDNSELKFYAQRSSFVEFKANVRHTCFVKDWYHRIQLVYGLSLSDALEGFNMQDKADETYYTESPWQFHNHSGFGITHMLVKKDYKPPVGTLILSNNTYAVYKL